MVGLLDTGAMDGALVERFVGRGVGRMVTGDLVGVLVGRFVVGLLVGLVVGILSTMSTLWLPKLLVKTSSQTSESLWVDSVGVVDRDSSVAVSKKGGIDETTDGGTKGSASAMAGTGVLKKSLSFAVIVVVELASCSMLCRKLPPPRDRVLARSMPCIGCACDQRVAAVSHTIDTAVEQCDDSRMIR